MVVSSLKVEGLEHKNSNNIHIAALIFKYSPTQYCHGDQRIHVQTCLATREVFQANKATCSVCMLGLQMVFKTRCTPVGTLTLTANNFGLVDRPISQGFEVELAFQNTFFANVSC